MTYRLLFPRVCVGHHGRGDEDHAALMLVLVLLTAAEVALGQREAAPRDLENKTNHKKAAECFDPRQPYGQGWRGSSRAASDAAVHFFEWYNREERRLSHLCHHISDLEGGLALAVLAQPEPLAKEGGGPAVDVLAIEEAELLIAEAGRRDAHHLHLHTHNTQRTFSPQVLSISC